MATCNFRTAAGPCRNPVGQAARCAAGHPVRQMASVQAGGVGVDATADPFADATAGAPGPGSPPKETFAPLLEHPALVDVIDRFDRAGVELHVVGGPVRDLLDNGHPGNDLDLCTPADVDTVKGLIDDLGAVPPAGQEFGTVRLCRDGLPDVEITQWRAETYRDDSRKPETTAGDTLEGDLQRRDFTVNAMAVRIAGPGDKGTLVDPYGGQADLAAGVLRTPGDPDTAFSDDPLRTVRMVRFAATRGWTPEPKTAAAAARQADRLDVAAPERRLAEVRKILGSSRHDALASAIGHAQQVGVGDRLFGGLDHRHAARYDHAQVAPTARLALLVHATGDPERARRALRTMKFSNAEIDQATRVAEVARQAPQVADTVTARRMVRHTTDEDLNAAHDVVSAAGQAWWPGETSGVRRDAALLRAPLPVDGRDAMQHKGLSGRDIGDWLRRVEDEFVASPHTFDRARALAVR